MRKQRFQKVGCMIQGTLIFYWIHKKFPNSNYQSFQQSQNILVNRPMFWDSREKMHNHLVVIDSSHLEHITQHYRDTIFVCVGCDHSQIENNDNEIITIENQLPLTDIFNMLLETFDLFTEWEANMEKAVNYLFSFDSIIESCDPLLDDPLALMDTQFRFVSYSKRLAFESGYEKRYVGSNRYLHLEDINHLTAMTDFKKLEKEDGVFQHTDIENVMLKNIYSTSNTYVGRLALPVTDNIVKNEYYKQILNTVAKYVEALYAKFGSFWHHETSVSNTRLKQILCSLLGGNAIEQNELYKALTDNGYDLHDQYYLVQIKSHFTNNENKLGRALTNHLENLWPGSCCITYQQKVSVLINITKYECNTNKLFTQELAYFLRESLLIAGISRKFINPFHIHAAYQQTDIALDFGQSLNPMYWYFKFDDYAYFYLLHYGANIFLPEQICDVSINILREYDAKYNTELNKTLYAYIKLQYNAMSAAKELCIARSTFLKRMDRIKVLTGIDLSDFQQRIYLAISYEIFKQYNVEL